MYVNVGDNSRNTNNKINKLLERALRLANDDYTSTFEELLEKDKSFTVHHYNIFSVICLSEIILIIICTHNRV